jgi:hypothetical protein
VTRALLLVLVPLVGCFAEEIPEPVDPAPEEPAVMAPAMVTIPATELEMLEAEITALRAETDRLTKEIAEQEAPRARQAARMAQASTRLQAAESELTRLRAELDQTRQALVKAEQDNEVLRTTLVRTSETLTARTAELEETRQDLARKEVRLRETRDDLEQALRVAADAGWSDLVAQAQVELCPKGGRRKMEACREEALAAVSPLEAAVRACLRTGQATPTLEQLPSDRALPAHGVWIQDGQDGWYVELCDPSLPEARALLASRKQAPGPRADTGVTRTARTAALELPARNGPRDTPEPPVRGGDTVVEGMALPDLDAEDDMTRRERRQARKAEEERLEALEARRRVDLSGVGDDLFDE